MTAFSSRALGLHQHPIGAGRFDSNLEKTVIRLPSIAESAVPLEGVLQLHRRAASARLEKLRGAEAALTLMGNLYNEVLRPPEVFNNQMAFSESLSKAVAVWRLRYPNRFGSLPAAARLIQGLWMN
ncbi:MAG: hypothetical protein HY548_05315 [Elusimicrobia bacterium]|nr:hypothetical protein [Elusimicrobiota bacterium]